MRLRPPSLLRPGRRLAAVLLCATAAALACGAAATPVRGTAAVPALACTAPAAHLPRAVQALEPLSALVWPAGDRSELTRHFGGISGIDFDPRSGRW